MKRFLLQMALLILILFLADFCIGRVFSYIENNAKGGFTYRDMFICNRLETDILISGSSRCVHHYNPQIISDSLHMTCYNSGQMGNGIILNYGRFRMINERRKPKVVIYDVTPDFDLLLGEDNHRYLTWLKSHYERDGIIDIFNSIDKTEKYKMQSKMYRYNSRCVEILADYVHPVFNIEGNGFSPLIGKLDKTKIKEDVVVVPDYYFDDLKINYISKMIEEAKGSIIIFVASPIWYGKDRRIFQPLMQICKERNIPFIDYSNDPKYIRNDFYFKDGNHLNEIGANEFSMDLIKDIRTIL